MIERRQRERDSKAKPDGRTQAGAIEAAKLNVGENGRRQERRRLKHITGGNEEHISPTMVSWNSAEVAGISSHTSLPDHATATTARAANIMKR